MDEISVCLTVYNEEKGVKRVLDYLSVCSNLFDDLVIVSDNCVDDSDKIIEAWCNLQKNKKISFFMRNKRFGRANAIRLGLKNSKHDIVIILASDIKPLVDSLKNLIRYFHNLHVGAVTGHPILLNKERTVADCLSLIMWDSHDNIGKIESGRGSFFHLNGEMFGLRKSALKGTGFNDYNSLGEDAMLGWLIYQNGFMVLWADDVEYYMRYPSGLMDWLRIRKRCLFSRVELADKENIEGSPFYELSRSDYLVNVFRVSRKSLKRLLVLPLGSLLELAVRLYYQFSYNKSPPPGIRSGDILTDLWQPSKETKW